MSRTLVIARIPLQPLEFRFHSHSSPNERIESRLYGFSEKIRIRSDSSPEPTPFCDLPGERRRPLHLTLVDICPRFSRKRLLLPKKHRCYRHKLFLSINSLDVCGIVQRLLRSSILRTFFSHINILSRKHSVSAGLSQPTRKTLFRYRYADHRFRHPETLHSVDLVPR